MRRNRAQGKNLRPHFCFPILGFICFGSSVFRFVSTVISCIGSQSGESSGEKGSKFKGIFPHGVNSTGTFHSRISPCKVLSRRIEPQFTSIFCGLLFQIYAFFFGSENVVISTPCGGESQISTYQGLKYIPNTIKPTNRSQNFLAFSFSQQC